VNAPRTHIFPASPLAVSARRARESRLTASFRNFPPSRSYASYKAIESEATDDDTQWLTYWVVYSMLMIFESFADYSVFWIPGYRFAKCGFIFWLASPRFKGAIMLYEKVFKDALKAAEPIIDTVAGSLAKGDINTARAELSKHVDVDKLQKFGSEAFEKTMSAAAEASKMAQEGIAAAKEAQATAAKKD
jgi:receptor expression-enhancing protein 5/6